MRCVFVCVCVYICLCVCAFFTFTFGVTLMSTRVGRKLPTGGKQNRNRAQAQFCPLKALMYLSSLPLNSFTSEAKTTSFGNAFHISTTLDVKLFLLTSNTFLFLNNFLQFFLPLLSDNSRNPSG